MPRRIASICWVFGAWILLGVLQPLSAQELKARGPMSDAEVVVKMDTIRAKLDPSCSKKAKRYYQMHTIESPPGVRTAVEVVAVNYSLEVHKYMPEEKKPRILLDKYRAMYNSKPSEITTKLSESTPGSFRLLVTSQEEMAQGAYEIRITRSSGLLSQVNYKSELCAKIDAILGHREVAFWGLRGRKLKEDRARNTHTYTTYLNLIDAHRAHVEVVQGEPHYEAVLSKTEYPAIAIEVYTEFAEALKSCFAGNEGGITLVERSKGSRERPYRALLVVGAEPEQSTFSLILEENKSRSGYFSVVLRVRR